MAAHISSCHKCLSCPSLFSPLLIVLRTIVMKLLSFPWSLLHYCCVLLLVLARTHDSFGLQQQRTKPSRGSVVIVHAMNHRRALLGAAVLTTTSLIVPTEGAMALKTKDEMLCGTGFFTNIAQYKCTELGDIWDEGKPKEFNAQELGSMESLMGKIGKTLDDEQSEDKGKSIGKGGVSKATAAVSDNKP
jgi:hypothetical protein